MAASLADVIDQMLECGIAGLRVEDLIADGRKHAFRPDSQKRKKSAWYALHEHRTRSGRSVYAGAFGDRAEWWKIKPSQGSLTTEERAEFAAAQKRAERDEAKRRAEEAAGAAAKAARLWAVARDEGASPYLDRKKVRAYGVRFLRAAVVVPMRDVAGALSGCQFIGADGAKVFNTGAEKTGRFHLLGAVAPGRPLLFAEGYATAASIHEATGWPVVAAFDAGNLEPCAAALRPLYPDAAFVFCGDDDRHLRRRLRERLTRLGVAGPVEPDGAVHVFPAEAGELRVSAQWEARSGVQEITLSVTRAGGERRRWLLENAGRVKALACARRFKAVAVFPAFAAADASGTDFNDLHLAEGLGVVRSQIVNGIAAAKGAAAGERVPPRTSAGRPTLPPDDWRARLVWRRGELVACLSNVHDILANDAEWAGVLAFNDFSQGTIKLKPPPYEGAISGEWEGADDTRTAMWLTRRYGFVPSSLLVAEAVEVLARAAPFHPVRDWLRGLVWDQVPRLDGWLLRYLGVQRRHEEDEYPVLVARWFLLGMVARVMAPGSKFDYCLVLEGPQGKGKSMALAILGGEWFGNTDIDLANKDSMSALRGKWLHEFAEMGSVTRAEATKQKSFLSRQVDEYRPVYGRREIRAQRQTVFCGSTNEWEWNKDPTGGRRFWPVQCEGEFDLDGLRSVRDALFAEAYARYRAGERYYPTPADQAAIFDPEQFRREQQEALIDALHDWVFLRVGQFSLAEAAIEGLKIEPGKLTRDIQTRVGVALRKLGCERIERRNGMVRFWYLPPRPAAEAVRTEAATKGERDAPF